VSALLRVGLIAASITALILPLGPAEAKEIPFIPGETLFFEVSWGIIPAGRAVLKVGIGHLEDHPEGYHFSVEAYTYPLIDIIYKVRDRIDSFTDKAVEKSLIYRFEGKGKKPKSWVVHFDWQRLKAQYTEGQRSREAIDIPPGTLDPLSIFYAFRLQPLSEGLSLSSPVTDGKRCVIGSARVLKKEKIKVPAGTFETYLVEPDLKEVRGIFEKSPGASLHVWVTSDGKSIPVRIKSKVIVGSFVAELTSIQNYAIGDFLPMQ
jgi:hypothetical protein